MKLSALNAISFQIGWFACVLGGNVVGACVTALLLVFHGKYFIRSKNEWWLIVGFGFTGLVVDSVLGATGVLDFGTASALVLPTWLLCLWVLFATTLCHSFVWLQQRLVLGAALAGIATPWSYFAGSKLTQVSFAEPVGISLLLIGACWTVIFPLSLYFARRCR